jgi:hypothetical protein
LIKPKAGFEHDIQKEGISHLIDIQIKPKSENAFIIDDSFDMKTIPKDNNTVKLKLF